MFKMDEIFPVSEFSRKPAEHIKRLKQTSRPEILTINGKAELVVQDARAYEEMIELLDTLEAIAKSAKQFDEGKGIPAREAFAKIRKSLIAKYPDAEL